MYKVSYHTRPASNLTVILSENHIHSDDKEHLKKLYTLLIGITICILVVEIVVSYPSYPTGKGFGPK